MERWSKTYSINAAEQFKSVQFARLLALLVFALGALVLIGWQFELDLLRRPIPQSVAMNPLTALLFVFTGSSFLLLTAPTASKRLLQIGYFIASMVILLAAVRFFLPLFVPNYRIDFLLFSAKIDAEASRGLISGMAVNTAIAFLFSGTGLVLFKNESQRIRAVSHIAAWVIFTFGFFSITGYLYKAPEFYNLLKQLPMAVHSAIGFLLVSLAFLFVNRQVGFFKAFFGDTSASYFGRVFLINALIIPLVLGAFAVWAYRSNLISAELSITLLVLVLIGIFCALITYTVIVSNKKDNLRLSTEAKLRESQEVYRSLVTNVRDYAIFGLDVDGKIVTWNKGAEAIKGYTEDEVKGKNISLFYTQEDKEKNLQGYILKMAKEHGRYEQQGFRVRKDGTTFWADGVVTALYTDEGVLTGFAALDRDNTERKKAKDLLSKFNDELSKQLAEQTAELRESTTQLRQLAANLQTVREEERKRIAREIHDELSQMLTGLRMDMVWIRKRTATEDLQIEEKFDRALALLSDARQEVRRLATDLHPALLEHLGLGAALEGFAREFAERMGIKVVLDIQINGFNDVNLAESLAIGFYRVFQEALTNTVKHANATIVNSFLKIEDGNLVLGIRDNGKGFDMREALKKNTLGIISMRERALMMGGNYELQSEPEKGTTILLNVPLKTK